FSLFLSPPLFAQTRPTQEPGLKQIRTYIADGWDTLTRSMTDCNTVVDPKLAASSVLYLPADFAVAPSVQEMQTRCKVRVEHLPKVIHGLGEIDTSNFD